MPWTPPNRGKTTVARNINTSNRPTMGVTAFQLAIAQPPLKGTLQTTRPGKRTEEQTKGNRQQQLERLGPSFRIVPSIKAADSTGLAASTTANGRLMPSVTGTSREFRGGQMPLEGIPEVISTQPWRRGR